jgi:chitinase
MNKTSGEAYLSDVVADTQYDESIIGPVPQDLPFKGGLGQLILLKRRYPHLKTIISVGGYGTDNNRVNAIFTHICQDNTLQPKLVKSIVNITKTYGFDGSGSIYNRAPDD